MFCFDIVQDAFWIPTLRAGIYHGQKGAWNVPKRSPAGRELLWCGFKKKYHFRICDGAAIRRLGTELPATIAISRKISAIGLILTFTITPSNRLVFHFENWNSMIQIIIKSEPITFYDSVTGKPLFNAPVGRTMSGFLKESQDHGWPSFRDEEVVWENVRCLENGETVSLDGSHLGHNIPDNRGNRYCINLVSVAGKPSE